MKNYLRYMWDMYAKPLLHLGTHPEPYLADALYLDNAHVGGFIAGDIIEVYGTTGSGKTTFAWQLIAAAQKTGAMCALIDVTHMHDTHAQILYATSLGVQSQQLVLAYATSTNHALHMCYILMKAKIFNMIVMDHIEPCSESAQQKLAYFVAETSSIVLLCRHSLHYTPFFYTTKRLHIDDCIRVLK